jgi:hypothetical protein
MALPLLCLVDVGLAHWGLPFVRGSKVFSQESFLLAISYSWVYSRY